MLKVILAALGLVCGPALAQSTAPNQAQQDQDRFEKALSESVMPLMQSGEALTGTGGAWLTEKAAKAGILMIGEMHGVADIARAASTLARANGARIYAAEVGDTAAWKLNPLLVTSDGAFEAYMADARRANSFAFLNMREEADFARTVMRHSDGQRGEMWGLDQEFITSGPVLMERLASLARTPAQKEAVDKARPDFEQNFFALSKVPKATFENLRAAFAKGSPAAQTLIEDTALSNDIYAALGYAQNAPREELMKRKFLMHWRKAAKARGGAPKVVMKFGSNHLQAGLSTTMVPALGGFVRNLALMEGKNTFSVFILCGPDGAQRAFDGSAASCQKEFEGALGKLAAHARSDTSIVFNTAPLRAIAGTLKRLNVGEDARQYIFSYDALVVLNDATPATHFATPKPEWFQQ
ncbi:MAG: hypothetical protein JNK21_02980 [Rhodospirillaceae bacterium]|nr:hypothetical protein [Rhodospirillaceae bacterium]